MNEKILTSESATEKIPTEEEVLSVLEEIVGPDYEIYRNLQDDKGPYMFEVLTTDDDGDTVQHNYIRAGTHPEGFSNETVIEVIYFDGDRPVSGRTLKRYREGVWK